MQQSDLEMKTPGFEERYATTSVHVNGNVRAGNGMSALLFHSFFLLTPIYNTADHVPPDKYTVLLVV